MKSDRKLIKILVVDDDMPQRLVLKTHLEDEGHTVEEAENGAEAFKKLVNDPAIRLVLTDLTMPVMNGFELIERIRKKEIRYTYIIVLTSSETKSSLIRALSLGADDYLHKPVFLDEVKLRIKGGLRLLKLESQEELIFSMAKMAEFRSNETGFHLERVFRYAELLARDFADHYPEYGLGIAIADEIAKVSPLHDVGKIGIPDAILHKPGKLTPEEWALMKTHTTIGANLFMEIYKSTGAPYIWNSFEIALYHHERWDGAGYPIGLSGENIPLAARIVALADVYDALTSRRSYKDPVPHAETKALVLQGGGTQFDPRVVEGFLRQESRFLDVKEQLRDGDD